MFAPLNSMVSVSDLIQGARCSQATTPASSSPRASPAREDAFVKEMNKYAKEIGLTKSHFVNSTGLPAEGHVMTARELALLANYLIKTYPEYYHYFGEKEFNFGKWKFTNRNPLVFEDLGVDGLKTGFIEDAGYGLVASARSRQSARHPGGERTQHQEGARGRAAQAARMGFQELQAVPAVRSGRESERCPGVGRHPGTTCRSSATSNIDIILPFNTSGQVTAQIVYDGPIKAPIRKGDQVATLRVTAADTKATNDIPLYAGEDIGQSNFAMRGLDSLLVLAFGWLL